MGAAPAPIAAATVPMALVPALLATRRGARVRLRRAAGPARALRKTVRPKLLGTETPPQPIPTAAVQELLAVGPASRPPIPGLPPVTATAINAGEARVGRAELATGVARTTTLRRRRVESAVIRVELTRQTPPIARAADRARVRGGARRRQEPPAEDPARATGGGAGRGPMAATPRQATRRVGLTPRRVAVVRRPAASAPPARAA